MQFIEISVIIGAAAIVVSTVIYAIIRRKKHVCSGCADCKNCSAKYGCTQCNDSKHGQYGK